MKMQRVWAMPNSDTFDVTPIGNFVRKYLANSKVSIDPFARNKRWATYTNDLNPKTAAEYHMDALDFLTMLRDEGVRADLVIFDPPYSPRQIKECYEGIGMVMKSEDAWLTHNWGAMRDMLHDLIVPNGYVLSFGWNSCGMGKVRGYSLEELLLVCSGAGHNDTICIAERKVQSRLTDMESNDA